MSLALSLVGPSAELIGPADQDRADQGLEVELHRDELGGQAVEQLVVRGGVGVAEVIHRLDDPPADQVIPDPVDQALGEERIGGTGEPGGEGHPAVRHRRVIEHGAAEQPSAS